MFAPLCGRWSFFFCGRRKGFCTRLNVSKTWRMRNSFKNVGRRRTCKDAFRVAGAVQETCSWEVRRSGRWFAERGCSLEHQIFRSAIYFRHMDWKNRKTYRYGAVNSALKFPLLKEVSQNCFVFDFLKFENWGSLAELLPFARSQVPNSRKPRRISAFLMLSTGKIEEVSQVSFVFKLADRQIDR